VVAAVTCDDAVIVPSLLAEVDRDPLDDVAGDLAPPPIIETGRPGIGMPSQVLDVFQSRVLL
jgi:hypothetical protein